MLEQTEHAASSRSALSAAPIRAAIDIGSNTVHLVIARCLPDHLEILADELELVRIGESVNATGAISPQKRDQTIATLQKYQALAEQHVAEDVLVVATEAIRQATNSEEFLAAILASTGLVVHVIGGNVEATLTFLGATYELQHDGPPPTSIGVMDLGGGSMELVIAHQLHIAWSTSVPIGSGRLHDHYLPSDPPTHEEFEAAQSYLKIYFREMPIQGDPAALIAVGGSANTLLYLACNALGVSQAEACLTYEDLVRCEGILRALTASEVAQRYPIVPQRARILPAGALIIRLLLERLDLKEIHVSTHGIREGVLLARARYGEQWLAQLQAGETAPTSPRPHEHAAPSSPSSPSSKAGAREEVFQVSGRRLLLERARTMLEWREEVLKHEDIEAVHRMRVASRRLRAVLDAYKTACDPQRFKKVYRRVKELASILGKARDTDVMIEHLREQMRPVPLEEQVGMQWLVERLSAYRQQHQRKLEAFLKDLDGDALLQQIKACLPKGSAEIEKARSVTGEEKYPSTVENARLIAQARLEKLYSWAEYVDEPYNISELHNLRIAAKGLRYSLEIFADVLPDACGPLLKEVEQIQEELGALHDSDVMIALLRLCLGGQDSGTGYTYLLARTSRLRAKGNYVLNPELVAHLFDSAAVPSAVQRRGLELLLNDLQKSREERYKAFRQHWHQLQYRDFRNELLAVLHL